MTNMNTTELERLESLVEQQQETIADLEARLEAQQSELAAMHARQTAAEHPLLVADGGDIRVIGDMSADGGVGVQGTATGAGGTGVEAVATADEDDEEGVPTGVHAEASGDGNARAVRAVAPSLDGRGIIASVGTEEEPNLNPDNPMGVVGYTDKSSQDEDVEVAIATAGLTSADSGMAISILGENQSAGGFAVLGVDVSDEGYGVASNGDALTDGDHEIDGELLFPDDTPQRTAGPVAKGYTTEETDTIRGVNVEDIEWNDGSNRYEIEFTDFEFSFNDSVGLVSTAETDFVAHRVSSVDNNMIVQFEDEDQRSFAFVVFDLPGGQETTTATTSERSSLLSSH